ncbi:MAG: endoflagellar protein [Candidatus Solibacter sp.]|nr:endoflagellar protein [Candidatus Solibacter sp.]
MIQLTRLNHVPFFLNPDLVEQIERTPDTVIRLTTGVRFVVVEQPEVVVERIIAYRQRVVRGAISAEAAENAQPPALPDGGE